MSFNQSRSDKSETQYRKTPRSTSSNQQRGSSGDYGKGSGAGAGGPSPSPSISSNRSFKKSNNNAQGGQSRANVSSVHSSDSINASIPRGTQNDTHVQPQLHGASDVPVTSTIAKQTEPSATQRSSRHVPKAPTSQSASVSTDTTATTTPTKAPGDGSKAFPFQFGSISPGFMNGMQIPTRTSSAPPKAIIMPLQMMHKAEKKYEVGKVTDEEHAKQRQLKGILNKLDEEQAKQRQLKGILNKLDEEQAKQRQLKGILNKLTPQNFEKLFEQVKAVNIDNAGTLTGVVSQIFDKALMEPTFCEMYANFCYHLAGELPDFSEDNEKITFKRLLLNKCQEEFERGEREQEEANKADEEGEIKQTKEEREEKSVKSRRRMLGNIRLIGELYKKKMLTERIMHECIKKLLGNYRNPDEDDVEALCKLMSTIGEMIDHSKAKEHMDAYFDRMKNLSNNMKLSSRVRFMLKDLIDLRKNKWQQRRENKLLNSLLIYE